MLTWAGQRRILFVGTIAFLVFVVAGTFALFAFYNPPDCNNGSRDGDERDVDCGGRCPRVCAKDTEPLIIHFTRTLEVDDGLWGAVAYIENRNAGAGAREVPYVFKLYDAQNILLYERHGEAFIPPRKVFAIFEGQMRSGSRTPTRATFVFESDPVFLRMSEPQLSLTTKGFIATERGSSLEAIIVNPSSAPVEGIIATALLFASNGNVIGTSATSLTKLAGGGSATLTFTWPRQLEIPARTEVLYTVPGRMTNN